MGNVKASESRAAGGPREAALAVVRRLVEAGHTALFAGGCVRDELLGLTPADFDVATSARPEQVRALFRSSRAVGAHFGVVLVRVNKVAVEVATFRSDGAYSDGRRPDAVCFSTPEQDAQRRDFTVNGLFYDPLADRVIDYVGGRTDLQAGVLRAIGEPSARLAEDHLRLLRAVRFACRFDLEIEPRTWSAICEQSGGLRGVSNERLLDELTKLAGLPSSSLRGRSTTASERRARAVELLSSAGLLGWVLPGWTADTAAVGRAAAMMHAMQGPMSVCLMLAGWLGPGEAGCRVGGAIAHHLRMSTAQRRSLVWLLSHAGRLLESPGLSDLRRLRGDANWPELLCLSQACCSVSGEGGAALETNLERLRPYATTEAALPAPLVDGAALLARGWTSGPALGAVLQELYRRQLDEQISTVEEALAWAEGQRGGAPT